MNIKFLIFFLSFLSFGYCQDVRIQLLEAKISMDNKILLTLMIDNNSDKNYVINNNFIFESKTSDFLFETFVKLNFFVDDTINAKIVNVHFEKQTTRNFNDKKLEVFFIKSNSEELINICLNDYLSEAEKIGLGLKIISEDHLGLSLDFYQSEFINIRKRKILNKMKKENYIVFRGQIKTNKVILDNKRS